MTHTHIILTIFEITKIMSTPEQKQKKTPSTDENKQTTTTTTSVRAMPQSKYTSVENCFLNLFPSISVDKFQKEHGFDEELHQRDPSAPQDYMKHPDWVKTIRVFESDQKETAKLMKKWEEDFPEASSEYKRQQKGLNKTKIKYVPGQKMPEAEADAPKMPVSKYRNLQDCFRQTFPELNYNTFRETHGFDRAAYEANKNAHQKFHETEEWAKVKEIFKEDQDEHKIKKLQYEEKYPNASDLKRLTALRQRYENKNNPELEQQRKKKRLEVLEKRQKSNGDTVVSNITKVLKYMPDEVGSALSNLERAVHGNNLELIRSATDSVERNQEKFREFEDLVHKFYQGLNEDNRS